MDKEERVRAGSLRPLFFLSPSHRPLCTFFFFLPSLPRTQRDLFGGESDKPSCFVFEMLLCLHVVVFKMLLHAYLFAIPWYVFVVSGENFRKLTINTHDLFIIQASLPLDSSVFLIF